MPFSKIIGVGHYLPQCIVKNSDLEKLMDTSHHWIVERTGIQQRHFAVEGVDTTESMGCKAAENAIQDSGISAEEIDLIIFSTLNPDYLYPGSAPLIQRGLKIRKHIATLDIRQQCTGFVTAVSIADAYIKTGQYKTVLIVCSELQSTILDLTTRGRAMSILFADGAGAVILQQSEQPGILSTNLHSEGIHAEELAWKGKTIRKGCNSIRENVDNIEDIYPQMAGNLVFKHAILRFEETIMECLQQHNLTKADIDMLIPHQANLRITKYLQERMNLEDDKVYSNIEKYGNTSSATIPICISELKKSGKIKSGALWIMPAFGAGFLWGSVIMRW